MESGQIPLIQKRVFQATCASLPAYVILFYDYLLTLNDEKKLIWPIKRFTVANVIFYLNRYVTLLGYIPILLGRSLSSERQNTCYSLLKYHQYLTGLIQVVGGVAFLSRTYALYGASRRILCPLAIFGFVVIGYGFWALHGMVPFTGYNGQHTSLGCLLSVSREEASHIAGAWIGMLFFDLTIFLMTVYKSISRWKEDKSHRDVTLLRILLVDGTIYFGAMVLLTLSAIISLFIMPEYVRGITTSLANILSSVMISRLIFNLRDPFMSSNRDSRLTMRTTTFPIHDTEFIPNWDFSYQLDGMPSQVTLLTPGARDRRASDVARISAAEHVRSFGEG